MNQQTTITAEIPVQPNVTTQPSNHVPPNSTPLVAEQPATCDLQPSTVLQLLASPLSTKDSTALARLDSAPPATLNSQLTAASGPRKLQRNGRIARLPKTERDMVNRMLWNHLPYNQIVEALSEIGYSVNERNVSNWATGGYLEWRVQQEAVLQHRLDQDHLLDFLRRENAGDLPEVGLQAAATRLSQVLLHKLATAENPEAHIDEYTKLVDLLTRLNREINATQKSRDDARRTLGKEYDPVRVREDNEIDMLETERSHTWEAKQKAKATDKPAAPAFLQPIPRSTINARDAAYDKEKRTLEFEKHQLQMLKALAGEQQLSQKPAAPKP